MTLNNKTKTLLTVLIAISAAVGITTVSIAYAATDQQLVKTTSTQQNSVLENKTAEQIQEKQIFGKILELQNSEDLTKSDLTKAQEAKNETDRLIAKGKLAEKQEQIAQLDAVLKKISPIRETGTFVMTKSDSPSLLQKALAANNWSISDSNHGCSGSLQQWNVEGDVSIPSDTTQLDINYPSSISIGLSPFCTGTDWNNFGFQVDDITQDWSCNANFNVFSVDNFDATCVGHTMNSGDLIEIHTSGNYDSWALPNTKYWVP